jgi:hypothetical protein
MLLDDCGHERKPAHGRGTLGAYILVHFQLLTRDLPQHGPFEEDGPHPPSSPAWFQSIAVSESPDWSSRG